MGDLKLYTPEICEMLRRMAEERQWNSWRPGGCPPEILEEEVELTYHLHIAADAQGRRAGLPPLPKCPVTVRLHQKAPDPVEFVRWYHGRRSKIRAGKAKPKRGEVAEPRCGPRAG